jgi:hypothetical protein
MHERVINVKDDDRSLCQSKVNQLPSCLRAEMSNGLEAMQSVVLRGEAVFCRLGLDGLVA